MLRTSVNSTTLYLAFNMLDDAFGGYSEENEKLCHADSLALVYTKYIEIFLNGRGVLSHDLIAPEIFESEEDKAGIDPYVYNWDTKREAVRKSLHEASRLLAEAGYAGGQDNRNNPLVLHYDNAWTPAGSTPRLAWMRNQLEKNLGHDGKSNDRLQPLPRQTEQRIFSTHFVGMTC